MDINLSRDDETVHLLMLDASANQNMSSGDDAGEGGATSVEPITPGPIESSVPEKSKPSTAD
jgi:hypothetical protein